MITKEIADRIYVWKKNPAWYRPVNNSYEYELTDQAPEKARKSYADIKRSSTDFLLLMALRLMTG